MDEKCRSCVVEWGIQCPVVFSLGPSQLGSHIKMVTPCHHIWPLAARIISMGKDASGWWFQPLWKIWKSMERIIPYIMENKTCSKPPTSIFHWKWSEIISGKCKLWLSKMVTSPPCLVMLGGWQTDVLSITVEVVRFPNFGNVMSQLCTWVNE